VIESLEVALFEPAAILYKLAITLHRPGEVPSRAMSTAYLCNEITGLTTQTDVVYWYQNVSLYNSLLRILLHSLIDYSDFKVPVISAFFNVYDSPEVIKPYLDTVADLP